MTSFLTWIWMTHKPVLKRSSSSVLFKTREKEDFFIFSTFSRKANITFLAFSEFSRVKIKERKKMESLSSVSGEHSPIRPRLLSHDEEEEIVAAVRVGKHQKVRGHRRRHLSTGDSEPIIRNRTNSLKTIYTAGRPPWYKSNGEQGTCSIT